MSHSIERYLHKWCGTTNTTAGSRDWSRLKWLKPAHLQEAPRKLDSRAMHSLLLDMPVVIRAKPDKLGLRETRPHSDELITSPVLYF